MYTYATVFLLAISAAAGPSLGGEKGKRPPRRLLSAIREVETGSQPASGRNAVGDNGRSVGPYQIQKPYWRDSGVNGRYAHVRNPQYAERVMLAYWRKYCPTALARGDWRTLARVHNGGPDGDRKAATLKYWQRVKRALEES